MNQAQWLLNSSVGPLYLVSSTEGLQGVFWKKQKAPLVSNLKGKQAPVQILALAAKQLDEYLSGQRKIFELPFDVRGTEFQKQVWKQLSKIPYGKTSSYRDIAGKIKNEKAARAVGTASGRNPLCIMIPCHRVIAADGSMGGYSGGLAIKSKLIALEKGALSSLLYF